MSNSFQLLIQSETNEWYTPKTIIEAAIEVMGGIDLDPASNDIAQEWIRALRYYTFYDDAFYKNWEGRIWLNPPYGQRNFEEGIYGASAWLNKCFYNYKYGDISEAIILARGDSEGVRNLVREAPVFIECDRIAFLKPDMTPGEHPVPGSKIFYLGQKPRKFATVFQKFGIPLSRYLCPALAS